MNQKITILFVSASRADGVVLSTLLSQDTAVPNARLVTASSAESFYHAIYSEQGFQVIVIDQEQPWTRWQSVASSCSAHRPHALQVLLTDVDAPIPFDDAIAVTYQRTSIGLVSLARLIGRLGMHGQSFGLHEDLHRDSIADQDEAAHERERLVYAVSHDLQDPLQLARRYADILSEDFEEELGDAGCKVLDHLQFNLTRTQEMLDELLDYSRLERAAPQREPVDLNVLVDEVVDLYRVTLDEIGASVTKLQEFPILNVDRRQLQRVFQNLIGNAIKFRSERPLRITMRAQRVRDEWRIGIKDNGVGIAADDRKRIFDMFERAGNAAELPGTGMGLAICKRIVQNHGGRIWVRSTPGSGSVLIFSIPQSDEVVEAQTA